MGNLKKSQRFFKGINSDISPSIQPDNTYRWAHNMDIVAQGDEYVLNQVRSIAQGIVVGTELRGITPIGGSPVQTPDASFNILGYTQGLGIFAGLERDCIVIFTHGTSVSGQTVTNKSTIFVYDCNGDAIKVVGGATEPLGLALDFPAGGSIDAIVTRDRGIPIVYFLDSKNVMRRFVLDDSVYLNYQRIDELSVPRLFPTSPAITNVSIETDGSLLAGTYQFAYRFRETSVGNFSKWSLFTNPVPAIPENQGVIYGGAVGQVTNKSIKIDITASNAEQDIYDVIEIATIKNNTGENITQEVAFVSTHAIAGGTTTIVYDGSNVEYELPVTEITVDDAAVETAKTIIENNGRVMVGSVKYFNRLLSETNGVLKSAVSIKESVDYKNEAINKDKVGHFRGEVYRYGITYVDKYGNWSAVKPLDFGLFKRTTTTGSGYMVQSLTSRVTFGEGYSTNLATITLVSGASDFNAGDVIRLNFGTVAAPDFRYYDVIEVQGSNVFVAAYEAFPTTVLTDLTAFKCLGNAYSHSASNDWKYVGRDKFGYSIIDDNADAQALGLRVVIDGTSHPNWAVGVAVVRMERDKNIIYQTPIVPARNVVGVCTPGKNTQTNNDYPIASNGAGAFDHLAPKILQLGTSRDMVWRGLDGSGFLAYQALHFRDVSEAVNFENNTLAIDNRWDVAFAPAVDYVANNLGVPLVDLPTDKNININLVDACAFTKKLQTNSAGAKVYECLSRTKYFYDGTTSSHKVENIANPRTYANVFYPRLQDTIACQYKRLNQNFLDLNDWRTSEIYPIVNNSELVPLDSNASSYLGAKAVRLVAGEQLRAQQAITPSIPAANRDFFLGSIDVQRTLAIRMNQQLLDPLAPIAKLYDPNSNAYLGREVLWSNYFQEPTVAGAQVSRRIYNNDNMAALFRSGVNGSTSLPALLNDRIANEKADLDLAQAFFVVNMEAGKSDFRYGAASSASRFVWTGAYAPITNTSDITLDVWGGDCVISEFTYRVNDNVVIPRIYEPISGQDNVSWGQVVAPAPTAAAKAGVSRQQPEFIRMFVEAECNAFYISDKNRFPVLSRGVSDYTAPAFYDYNFGYSIRNTAKAFFSQDQSVPFIAEYPARILFSDARVSQSNDDGYSRFRALNFYDLEEKYGGIARLALLSDSEPIAVQDRAIRYLFVGKNILQDEGGGTILSVQSGQFISDVVKYLNVTYGAQNLRCVLSTEYGVFVLDSRNGMLLNVSDGVKLLSQGRIDKYLNDNFSSKNTYLERRLSLSYDSVAKEVSIIGYNSAANPANSRLNWIKYNAKIECFTSGFDYDVSGGLKNYVLPVFAVGVGGTSYLIHSGYQNSFYTGGWPAVLLQIGKMRTANTFGLLLLNTTAQQSYIDFVSNEQPDESKTFAIIGSNSALPFTSYQVTAFNEQQSARTTGNVSGQVSYRNGQAYAPFIRDNVQQGRLRGMYAIIRMAWNQTNLPARIYSVFSEFRKVFR